MVPDREVRPEASASAPACECTVSRSPASRQRAEIRLVDDQRVRDEPLPGSCNKYSLGTTDRLGAGGVASQSTSEIMLPRRTSPRSGMRCRGSSASLAGGSRVSSSIVSFVWEPTVGQPQPSSNAPVSKVSAIAVVARASVMST